MDPHSVAPSPRPAARQRIVETAHALFYRNGIRATGIDRIIAAAGVTKVTFYRHFPSKNDLVIAYLEYRHRLWIDWFTAALLRHRTTGAPALDALLPALREWLDSADYRGCAFINATVEFDGTQPGLLDISRRHKQAMTAAIAALLPAAEARESDAAALALAVDGAIIRAQLTGSVDETLELLGRIVQSFRPTETPTETPA